MQAELWAWFKNVVRERDFSRTLKMPQLSLDRTAAEVRTGFLTMILPLLRHREDVIVNVSLREHHEVRTDIKLTVEDKTRTMGHDKSSSVKMWRSNG